MEKYIIALDMLGKVNILPKSMHGFDAIQLKCGEIFFYLRKVTDEFINTNVQG